jgi:hypothetical protein
MVNFKYPGGYPGICSDHHIMLGDALTFFRAAWTMTSDGSLSFPLALHGRGTNCSTMAGVSTKVRLRCRLKKKVSSEQTNSLTYCNNHFLNQHCFTCKSSVINVVSSPTTVNPTITHCDNVFPQMSSN